MTKTPELQLTGEGVVRRCATLVGVHNYSGGDLREAVAFLERTQHKDQLRSNLAAIITGTTKSTKCTS